MCLPNVVFVQTRLCFFMFERTKLWDRRARNLVESIVLVIGYLLGGPVFSATFIHTFILDPIFQFSPKFFSSIPFPVGLNPCLMENSQLKPHFTSITVLFFN